MRRSIGRTVLRGAMAAMVAVASLMAGACGSNNNTTPTVPTTPITPVTTTETFSGNSDGQWRRDTRFSCVLPRHGHDSADGNRSGRLARLRPEPRDVERDSVSGRDCQRRRRAERHRHRQRHRRHEPLRTGLRRRQAHRSAHLHDHRRPSVEATADNAGSIAAGFPAMPADAVGEQQSVGGLVRGVASAQAAGQAIPRPLPRDACSAGEGRPLCSTSG